MMTSPIRTTLPISSPFILIVALLNIVMLIAVLTLLGSNALPRYGVTIKPAESAFQLREFDPRYMRVLNITPGQGQRFYLNNEPIANGLTGLSEKLDQILHSEELIPYRDRFTVIICADESISFGEGQQVINLILSKGIHCANAALPPSLPQN